MNKKYVIYICTHTHTHTHTGIVISVNGNEILPFATTCMDLEGIMLTDFPVAQMVKRLPTMQETWVQSLGREDLTPAFLPGKSHGWRSLVGLQSMGSQRVGHD